jgi:DNA-binding NtrC family response regulator/tetratricopeptide (TPR) repeat protein
VEQHNTFFPADGFSSHRYRFVRRLGSGAQGAVDLVEDRFQGNRRLAAKALGPRTGVEWIEAFRHEFEVLAGLRHPRLAEVHDFGVTTDGRVFFTRDWFPGDDLLAAAADLPLAGVIAAAVEVCRALAPLHSAGLVHGDLKPGNVILGPDGLARLIDFSFVRAPGADAVVRGTVQYMAPEVIEGRPADRRADLYSLGATLFEMVAGRPPFEGAVGEIAAAHLSAPRPVLEPRRAPGPGAEGLLAGLAAVVGRLLARDLEDRFPDASEAGFALAALVPGQVPEDPLAGIPVLPAGQAWERERRELHRAVDERLGASAGNRSPLHVVEGELGTGRSGLCRAIKWRAQLEGMAVIEARCEEGAMFEPARSIARQAAGMLGEEPAGEPSEIAETTRLIQSLARPGPGDDLDRLAVGLGRLVTRVSRQGPLLLVVDDADRAAPEAWRLLRGVLFSPAADARFAALVTVEAGFPWAERLGPGLSARLPRFDRPRIAALIRAHFGRVEEAAVERVLEHTGGNPAFVGALLADLAAAGEGLARLERLGPPVALADYWNARIPLLPPADRAVLEAAAVLGRASGTFELARVAGVDPATAAAAAARLAAGGWLRSGAGGWLPAAGPLRQTARSLAEPGRLRELHVRAIEDEPDEARRLGHAAACGRLDLVRARALPLAAELELLGALDAAAALLEQSLAATDDPAWRGSAALALGRVLLARGETDRARPLVEPLLADDRPVIRRGALLLLGRLHGRRRELSLAAGYLDAALELSGDPGDTARVLVERANVEFTRGDNPAAVRLAGRGLDLIPDGHPTRAALLAVVGKVASVEGRHEEAVERCRRAVDEARIAGDRRSLALALAMLAWVRQQSGDLEGAARELEDASALNRDIGDYPRLLHSRLVQGDLAWWLERWDKALECYEEALSLAAAMGNPAQRAEALIGLGQALVKLGRLERAASLLARARADAEGIGQEELALRVVLYRGDLAAARGHDDDALRLWAEARDGLAAKGRGGVAAEIELEMAELRLLRAGPEDAEAARGLVESAAGRRREDRGRGFDDALEHLRGWLALGRGDVRGGLPALDRLADRLEGRPGSGDRLWRVHLTAARALVERGSDALARQRLRRAEAVLERLAENLPAEHRPAFWQDARRGEVRRLLAMTVPSSILGRPVGEDAPVADPEARSLYRVLEINKRLSSDAGVSRLMEEILDAAIELTGAERGFVLRPGGDGLEIAARREIGGDGARDAHARFSRSIAESAFLDREPVITVDALGDDRFSEFLSIHELRIRSVACVPVIHRGLALGVVYLENRLRRGRFDGGDLRVLTAFADQVAIALYQARLLEEARARQEELARATLALEAACARQASDLKTSESSLRLVRERLERARERIEGAGDYHGAIGTGPAMRRVFELIERVKDLDVPVVFVGESGTGKDLLARVLHDAGCRRERPFVALACGGVPETLLEAHLFGHAKGAFSGAAADRPGMLAAAAGGTLYLDDLGEMPARMQVDLLRVLQEGSYTPLGGGESPQADCRLVASSRVPLETLVEEGRLRADLFYRLQVVSIALPPLRERTEDIPVLALRIAAREARGLGLPPQAFEQGAVERLLAHDWPGNVRELEQAIRRALVIGEPGAAIKAESLLLRIAGAVPAIKAGRRGGPGAAGREDEARHIVEALERCQWNRSRAAAELHMPRRTFYRRLAELGITDTRKQ